MILFLPFAGVHGFNDQRHAENFVRYLFSQSKGNPACDRTPLNLITETAPDREVLRQQRNTDPAGLCARFLRERVPARDAAKRLADHGAYAIFALPVESGRVISNFLMSDGDDLKMFGDPNIVVSAANQVGGLEPLMGMVDLAFPGQPIVPHDDATVEEHEEADRAVHGFLLRTLPAWVRPLLLVSHHDQREAPETWHTNPSYHIHWLIEAP